jgi:hypothetical protein
MAPFSEIFNSGKGRIFLERVYQEKKKTLRRTLDLIMA